MSETALQVGGGFWRVASCVAGFWLTIGGGVCLLREETIAAAA